MRLRRRPTPPRPSPVPVTAALASDLARAMARCEGRPVTLDDLDRADLLAAVLAQRWIRAGAGAQPDGSSR